MSDLIGRPHWRSFSSYVMVTTGAVVGLSNFFQFPFLVTKYGGLFFLFFVLSLLLVSLPLLFTELLIGRRGMQNPVGSIELLSMESDANLKWAKLGWFSFIIVFLTLCYYTVSAAFPMGYFLESIQDLFGLSHHVESAAALNTDIMLNAYKLEACFVLFFVLAMLVVSRGINRGLEFISCITVPLYIGILLALAAYVTTHGYFSASLAHLLQIYHDVPVKEVFLTALSLALLNYNVGMGIMIVYGSYLPYHVPLNKTTWVVVSIDIIVSLLAYFVIYPLVLMSNPSGVDVTVTNYDVIKLFGLVPHGVFIASLFFFAAVLAGWTPIIAMIETAVITLIERLNLSRRDACILISIGVLVLGSFVVGAHAAWAQYVTVGGFQLNNLVKHVTMDIAAPISALLVAIFGGWIVKRSITEGELRFRPMLYSLWLFLVRVIAPILIIMVLVTVTILESMSY